MTVLMTLTIFFPATVIPSGIAVFCLSFGDGAASLIGSFFGKYGPRITKTKSLIGSLACAVGAIAGVYLMMLFVPFSLPFYAIVIIGVTTAACELVGYGMDNFAIVFGVTAISTLLMEVCV
jgi:dolichol kinase